MPNLGSPWSADQTQAADSPDIPQGCDPCQSIRCRQILMYEPARERIHKQHAFIATPRNPVRRDRLMDWRHRAICRDEDPELFFPIGNTGPALLQIEQAKTVCRRCPVVQDCLAWALESGQDAGVWGGLSEDERRALKRRNARARARLA